MAKIDLSRFTEQQIDAAQLLANKDSNGMTVAQIASDIGVDPRTLYRWQNDEDFIELLNHFAELSQELFVPELYMHLRKAVRGGSTRAMELALKNRGKLIEKREIAGSVELTARHALSEDAILAEIDELKKKIDGQRPNVPKLIEGEDK